MPDTPTQVIPPALGNGSPPIAPPPEPKSHRTLYIGLAVGAIVLVLAAIAAVILTSQKQTKHVSPAAVAAANAAYQHKLSATLTPIVSANVSLSKSLQDIDGSKGSIRTAKQSTKDAQAVTVAARGAVAVLTVPATQQTLSQQAAQALTQENGYLQAVSSTLANPNSKVAGSLQSLASATNSAFIPLANVAPGGSVSISGTDNLISWATDATKVKPQPPVVIHDPGPVVTVPVPSGGTQSAPDGGSTSLHFVDNNIQANGNVSDGLAENVFTAYWNTGNTSSGWFDSSVTAYSSASGQNYTFNCTTDQTTVWCSGTSPSTGNDLEVQFPMWAVRVY